MLGQPAHTNFALDFCDLNITSQFHIATTSALIFSWLFLLCIFTSLLPGLLERLGNVGLTFEFVVKLQNGKDLAAAAVVVNILFRAAFGTKGGMDT